MKDHQARIALYLTIFSILLPLLVLNRDGLYLREPAVFVLQGCMLVVVAVTYWFHGLIYFLKCNRTQVELKFSDCLRDFFYPMTLLVAVNVLFLGFFNIADDLHNIRIAEIARERPFPYTARFGVSVIEVFPEVQFPLGVVMYAFWGAFIFNNFNFIHRVVTNDFLPRVPILGTLRVVAAVFASVVLYFAFLSNTYDFSILKHLGRANINDQAFSPGVIIVASFFAGLFPFRTMRIVLRWIYDRISQRFEIGKYTHTPLTVIDGVTAEVEERLAESAIDSINALATATVAELKDPNGRQLPYPNATLKDWIDQAKLAQYYCDEKHIAATRALGIRTYSAMQQYQKDVLRTPSILDNVDPAPIPKDQFRHFVLYGQFP